MRDIRQRLKVYFKESHPTMAMRLWIAVSGDIVVYKPRLESRDQIPSIGAFSKDGSYYYGSSGALLEVQLCNMLLLSTYCQG